jgi:hypothetical protein
MSPQHDQCNEMSRQQEQCNEMSRQQEQCNEMSRQQGCYSQDADNISVTTVLNPLKSSRIYVYRLR